jgi:ABC-2 type transport system permease protein
VTLGKEISTGSILPIITKPLKRSTIYLAKFAAVIISLCISNLIVGLISFATALIFTNEEVSTQFFAVSFVGAFIFQVMFAAFGMCVGLIIGDNKTLMIGGGLAIAFMIVDAISTIDSVPTVVKYVSPYYYLALSHIAQFQELKPVIVYLVLVSIVITIAGVYLFKRKNIEI